MAHSLGHHAGASAARLPTGSGGEEAEYAVTCSAPLTMVRVDAREPLPPGLGGSADVGGLVTALLGPEVAAGNVRELRHLPYSAEHPKCKYRQYDLYLPQLVERRAGCCGGPAARRGDAGGGRGGWQQWRGCGRGAGGRR